MWLICLWILLYKTLCDAGLGLALLLVVRCPALEEEPAGVVLGHTGHVSRRQSAPPSSCTTAAPFGPLVLLLVVGLGDGVACLSQPLLQALAVLQVRLQQHARQRHVPANSKPDRPGHGWDSLTGLYVYTTSTTVDGWC